MPYKPGEYIFVSFLDPRKEQEKTYIGGLLQVSVFSRPEASWLQVGQASLQLIRVQSLLLRGCCKSNDCAKS